METVGFQADSASTQLLILPASSRVLDESSCRFRDFLLCHTKHPGKLVHTFPYRITRVNPWHPHENAQLVSFSQSCMDNWFSDSGFLRRIVFSNECMFQISVFAAIQNICIWAKKTKKNLAISILQQKSSRPTVWCAVDANVEVGPY